MPAPKYESTKRELIEAMRATPGEGSRQFDIAKAILEVKGQEDMTRATRALVFATIGLIAVTVAQVVIVFCQG
jgi:hypothetical protein